MQDERGAAKGWCSGRAAAALALCSGACGLVYQTTWMRELRLVFGSSTAATAAVLAIFMGGMGLGAALLGRRLERQVRPLRSYAWLELGIAGGALTSVPLIALARLIYLALGGVSSLGPLGATLLRLVLASVAIGGPALLMGGTLPALARAAVDATDLQRQRLALVYGSNTLGSVLGVLATAFWSFEHLGLRASLLLAALGSALVGLVALLLDRRAPSCAGEPAPAPVVATDPASDLPRPLLWGVALGTGAVFFLQELVWYRMAAPILGGSTYTFALVLACILLGLGAGGLVFLLRPPRVDLRGALGLTLALEGLVLLLPFACGDRLAQIGQHVHLMGLSGRGLLYGGWAVVASILVLPASLVAGYQFPLLVALAGRAGRGIASDTGRVLAYNTAGAVLGSLAGGFGLIPVLGATAAWRLSSLLLVALALLVLVRRPAGVRWQGAAALAAAVLALGLQLAQGPTAYWRHRAIGVGRQRVAGDVNEHRAQRREAASALAQWDGVEASLAVYGVAGLAVVSNGKSDGSTHGEAQTMVGVALLPALFHAAPQRALVIGLGTGMTAGWLARVPEIQRVDVAEIEPRMQDFAAMCSACNEDALRNPKVRVHLGDGRELLMTSRQRYDLIVSEPSNPFRDGLADFFAQDFFVAVDAHLASGGLFAQWLQGYEIDAQTLRVVLTTLRSVFASVQIFRLQPGDLLLLASREPLIVDAELVRRRLYDAQLRRGLWQGLGLHDAEGLVARSVGNATYVDRLIQDQTVVHTFDRPVVEYLFTRSLGRDYQDLDALLLVDAAQRGMQFPEAKGRLDWQRVTRLQPRDAFAAGRAALPALAELGLADSEWLMWGLRAQGRMAEARQAAQRSGLPPRHDMAARVARAHVLVATPEPDPAAREGLLQELAELERDGHAGNVQWLRAILALVDDDRAVLVERVGEALQVARRDAWLDRELVFDGLRQLRLRLPGHPLAEGVAAALAKGPLACHLFERQRLQTLIQLTAGQGERPPLALCLQVFGSEHERQVPWQRDLLEARVACLRAHQPALAAGAESDLQAFRAAAPPTLRDLQGEGSGG